MYEFDGYSMIWEQAQSISNGNYGRDHGISFIGNNGTLVLARGGWEVIPDEKRMEAVPLQTPKQSGLDLHTQNFLEVVKSRKLDQLTCPIQDGAHVATVCQMGNISYRTGGRLYWEEANSRFKEKEANAFLSAAVFHRSSSKLFARNLSIICCSGWVESFHRPSNTDFFLNAR